MSDHSAPSPVRSVTVRATPIELSQFIKFAGLADSGGTAKVAITEGRVQVNGAVERRKGRKLAVGDRIAFAGQTLVVAVA